MKRLSTQLWIWCILIFGLSIPSQATIYTVNSTTDANAGALGAGDLRWCMTQAFADATPGPHIIQFNIGAGGPQTITLGNDLPTINGEDGIVIDATTQPGYVNKPLITITRATGNNGFSIQTSLNVTVKGFVITGFQRGFMVDNACRFITISGNYINLNQAGTARVAPPAGGSGIFIQNSTDIIIGAKGKNNRNIIVAGGNHGIEAVGTSARLTIKNNFIGLYENGTSAAVLGCANHGIFLNGTDDCVIDSNAIANNGQDGILVDANALNALIRYNKIGTDSTGTVPAGNKKEGILVQNSSGAEILHNVISCNGVNGILIEGPTSNNAIIQGNHIGVNINGGGANFGNKGSGIYIKASGGHTIGGSRLAGEGNIISNNGSSTATPPAIPTCGSIIGNGIVFDGTYNTTVRGNYIGVDGTGNGASGNDNSGMLVQAGAADITIGGINPGEGNVVGDNGFACTGAGERRHGIQVYGGTTANVVIIGNHIGIGADGSTALGNSQDGISILQTSGHTIGGNTPAHRNIISSNRVGVFIQQGNSVNNLVIGNYIGTDASGMVAKPNLVGVQIGNGVGSATIPNFIGRANAGEGNLISGNTVAGIHLNGTGSGGVGTGASDGSHNTRIFNNAIGLDASGGPLGNEYGIVINEEAKDNFIGGSLALQPNVIAHNANNGLLINNTASNKNWISRNSFYCNEASMTDTDPLNKGINLNGIGNDNYGGGPGELMVYSLILPAPPNSDLTTLRGKAPANSIVEIFNVEECLTCDANGGEKVEGKTYRATVTADGSGNWSWAPVGGLSGQYTITATEPAGVTRNTSEFAPCGFITLPVALVSFKAVLEENLVKLTWITASERNNAYFNIQRSTDGVYFETIGKVLGNDNSNETIIYNYLDREGPDGVVYYRLMQVDHDGTPSLSTVIRINKSGSDEVKIYPNPVENILTLDMSFSETSDFLFVVTNSIGTIVFTDHGIAPKGFYQTNIDLSSLSPEMYFVTIQSQENVWVEKIIKK